MTTRTCYYFDPITSEHSGQGIVHPANDGDFVLPDDATWQATPDVEPGERALWNGDSWHVIVLPLGPEIDSPQEKVRRQRLFAYMEDVDGLYFGWQRGENTEAEWRDAVAAVREQYPYPSE